VRRTPYTARGISRVPCQRCGAPSLHQWQCCADDNTWRGLCAKCDVALNELVLRWFRFKDWRAKLRKYRERMGI
jgi:hypothetical protein